MHVKDSHKYSSLSAVRKSWGRNFQIQTRIGLGSESIQDITAIFLTSSSAAAEYHGLKLC